MNQIIGEMHCIGEEIDMRNPIIGYRGDVTIAISQGGSRHVNIMQMKGREREGEREREREREREEPLQYAERTE